jgi:hypothetical protein
MCPYDTRTAPAGVIEHVRRTHPHVATVTGHERNTAFEDPSPACCPPPTRRTAAWACGWPHRMCSYVSFERSPAGFTVRLVAGQPKL